MLIARNHIFFPVVGISLAVLLIGLTGLAEIPWLELGLFALVMVSTGIPHGATDHLIYAKVQSHRSRPFSWKRFLGFYLFTMILYSLSWIFLPGFSLSIFLMISAYHFGQSQVLYIKWEAGSLKKRLLGLAWGSLILSSLLLMHLEEVITLLASIISIPAFLSVSGPVQLAMFPTICGLIVLLLWSQALRERAMAIPEFLKEIASLTILLTTFYVAGLWLGFALYFGVWHALSSMLAEIEAFRKEQSYSVKAFIKDALPFSLISFAGIGILGLAVSFLGEQIPMILLLFIAISVLTLPHTIYMDRFYQDQ